MTCLKKGILLPIRSPEVPVGPNPEYGLVTSTVTQSGQMFQTGIQTSFKLTQVWQEYRHHRSRFSLSYLLYLETV